jgi:hypothetical protein
LDDLQVVEGITYLGRKRLHNNHIKHRCVVVNVIKNFNGDVLLPHTLRGVDTLSKEKGVFIEWDAS